MLDLRRLRLLTELARHGTIARVAEVVGYTPSAVSQALSQLERECGAALLERDGRSVRLTPAARRLVVRAEHVIAELDTAQAELAADQDTVRGTVVIGAFASAAARLVAPASAGLVAQHPDLEVSIHEHEHDEGLELLRAAALDVLVSETFDDVPPAPTRGFEHRRLLSEPLLLVLPTGRSRPVPTRLADLADAGWIAGRPGTPFAAALDRACRNAGFSPRVRHRADEAEVHRALVAAGLGVSLLPALACTAHTALTCVPVPDAPRRHITALTRRGTSRRPAVSAVLEALGRCSAAPGPRDASGPG